MQSVTYGLREARRDLARAEMNLRIASSDVSADPAYRMEAHARVLAPLKAKRARLQASLELDDADARIRLATRRLAKLRAELKTIANKHNVRKMLTLLGRLNGLKRRQLTSRVRKAMARVQNDKTQDLSMLVRWYEQDATHAGKLKIAGSRERVRAEAALARLDAALRTETAAWDAYLANVRAGEDGPGGLNDRRAEITRLSALVSEMERQGVAQEYQRALRQIEELVVQLGEVRAAEVLGVTLEYLQAHLLVTCARVEAPEAPHEAPHETERSAD
jgi:hypothetical protein